MHHQIYNAPQNMPKRKVLRQQDIGCEKLMWSRLRNRQIGGLKFRRQYGIGKYIVDFYCPALKLVIEIDGATHCADREIEYDSDRQRYIENLGITVKRYSNTDIKENFASVLEDIFDVCEMINKEQKPCLSAFEQEIID